MVCYRPLQAWYPCDGEKKGKVVFTRELGKLYVELPLPCGQCIGCRMEYARQWSIRCMHEAELHEDNCMVTLTYDDEHIPDDGSLRPEDATLWLKRLRKQYQGRTIRYFLAGEYGDEKQRPHYHVLLFGIDFADEMHYNRTDKRFPLHDLQRTWEHGNVHVAPLTYETAAYVARYCLKKQQEEIEYVDKANGVIRHREYTRMSRRPGIGAKWVDANYADTYKDDTVIVNGERLSRPPRYYDRRLGENENMAEKIKLIKRRRVEESQKRRKDNTEERLTVRERIARAKLAIKKRRYESI